MDNHTLAAVIAMGKKYANEITSDISSNIAQNVTDWLDEHVDPETGYVIDDTLTIQGAAADAKKTGDELTELKNDLKTVNSIIDLESPITVPYTIDGSGYIGSRGTVGSSAAYQHTDYIPFGNFTHFIYTRIGVTGSSAQYAAVYDKDKNFIRGYRGASNQDAVGYVQGVIARQDGDEYVRFSAFADAETYGTFELYADAYPLKTQIDNLSNRIDSLVLNGNVLTNKKWVACGDSFTHGDFSDSPTNDYTFEAGLYAGSYKVYPFWIGRRNPGLTVINEAINGSTMTAGESGVNPFSGTRYTAIPSDADYITLMFGINDSGNSCPIGTIDDADNTTFYGAWNVVLNHFITNFPYAHIGIIVGPGMQTTQGKTYAEAEIAVAKKWGIPYLNVQFESGEKMPLMLRTSNPNVSATAKNLRNSQQYVSDAAGAANHHPNANAHELESAFIEAWLRTI